MYQIKIEDRKELKWSYMENKYKNGWNFEGWNVELIKIENFDYRSDFDFSQK